MAIERVRSSDFLEVKLLVDMCLSPEWVSYFATQGIEASIGQRWAIRRLRTA